MENLYYTDERNTQIVISLLKFNGIRQIVTSPGTTHMCFVGSVIHDDYFKVYSCVDERSAAYMACGLASESGEPVVITCTGATASRNYYSALTEAFYRKLPIIAITAHQGTHRIGHLWHQNIDRRNLPYDVCKLSVEAVYIKDQDDERYCTIEVNKALLECRRNGGGPVHINLFTRYSKNFTVKELPPVKGITRVLYNSEFPELPRSNTAIFVGPHKKFNGQETRAIETFCESNNAVVFCDHTSGYHGKYRIQNALIYAQKYPKNVPSIDLLIHLGEVSGDNTSNGIRPTNVWRVSEDGEIRDTFGKLTYVFEMSAQTFFERYSQKKNSCTELYDIYKKLQSDIALDHSKLPLSSIWIASQFANSLPENCDFHMGIWSSLRSWNYFETPETTNGNCNVGGFGIDGCVSSLIGASLFNKEKLYIGIVGDLAFYYDMNVLGNRHVGNNVRLIVVNNGTGNEMRYSFSPASSLGDQGAQYLAASGHYVSEGKTIIKNYAESLGFEYLSAKTKEEVLQRKEYFLSSEIKQKPIVFEIFVDADNEDIASTIISNLQTTYMDRTKTRAKQTIKNIIGRK